MNDDTIADLKQFIAATVRQEVSGLATKDDVSAEIGSLRQEMNTRFDDLQTSVAQALDTTNDAAHEQLQDHEARLGRLEHRAA